MAVTISKVSPTYGKNLDNLTIIGTGFVDAPSKTLVYRRTRGGTSWVNVQAAKVSFVSATELTVALTTGAPDNWAPGLNDVGVAVYNATPPAAPEAYLEDALYYYAAGMPNPDNYVVGAPYEVYIEGRYMGHIHGNVDLDHAIETMNVEVNESLFPIAVHKTGESCSLKIPLAEVTLENIKDVWGIAASITEQGTRRVLTFGGDSEVIYKSVMLILPAGGGKRFALTLYRCAILASGTFSFAKEDQVDLPIELTVLADTSRPAGDQVGRWEEFTPA